MPPQITARSRYAPQSLIDRSRQTRNTERFSQASDRSSRPSDDGAEAMFLERRDDNDRRSVFSRVECFEDRHPVHSRIHIQHDGGDILEIVAAELEKLF